MEQISSNQPPAGAQALRVEAARYALLRRLAFAMRHHMVVNLQPIGMITEVMERRLKAAQPDLLQVQQSMERINGFSKAAVQSCLDVVSWLAPDPKAGIELGAGIAECLALLRSNLSFRGFTVRETIGETQALVGHAALRSVMPAALLTLTDTAHGPADVLVSTRPDGDAVVVTLAVKGRDGSPGFAGDPPYRILDWDEVQSLAQVDGASVQRDGDSVHLAFPRR